MAIHPLSPLGSPVTADSEAMLQMIRSQGAQDGEEMVPKAKKHWEKDKRIVIKDLNQPYVKRDNEFLHSQVVHWLSVLRKAGDMQIQIPFLGGFERFRSEQNRPRERHIL